MVRQSMSAHIGNYEWNSVFQTCVPSLKVWRKLISFVVLKVLQQAGKTYLQKFLWNLILTHQIVFFFREISFFLSAVVH